MDGLDNELMELHGKITEQLHDIEGQIVDLRARADGLRTTLRGIEETTGMRMHDRRRGAEAVSYVYNDIVQRGEATNDGGVTITQILDEMRGRGWLPESERPEGAVRSAIRRLRETDADWRLSRGSLYYVEEPPTPTVVPSVASPKGGSA